MSKDPLVSIIVPVYNAQDTVKGCVESLLAQTYPAENLEIIMVDNKSKDNTMEVLRPYAEAGKIKLLSETIILNAYGARNKGISASTGEILAFTDADCVAEPDWIEYLVFPFEGQEVGCVAGAIIPLSPRNVIEKYSNINFYRQREDQTRKVFGGNCAYRRKLVEQIGCFRTCIPSGGDSELAIRMQQLTKKQVRINFNAIVYHQNVDTLILFIKQFMRYGTQQKSLNSNIERNAIHSLLHMMKLTLVYFGSFLKRVVSVNLGFDKSIDEDRDIYILRPALRIIASWSAFWGAHKAGRNNESYR